SRDPPRSLNRAAVASVTATGTGPGGPCGPAPDGAAPVGAAPPGSEPATSLALRPRPLRYSNSSCGGAVVVVGAWPATANGAEPVAIPDQSAPGGASGRPARRSPATSWSRAVSSAAAFRTFWLSPVMPASASTVVADEDAVRNVRCRTWVR